MIKINNFQTGIAHTPLSGFADMRNLNVDIIGCIRPEIKTENIQYTLPTKKLFSCDYETDIFTINEDTWKVNQNKLPVVFSTTGTLPAPLVAGTVYWLKDNDYANGKYEVYTEYALTTKVNLTDNGTAPYYIEALDIGYMKYFSGDYAITNTGYLVKGLTSTDNFRNVLIPATKGTGNGLAYWKNYTLVFRSTKIDVYDEDTAAWTADWQTISSSTNHQALLSADGKVYFCNGRYIGCIKEALNQTFDPGTPDTFNVSASALDLGGNDVAEQIIDYGQKLAIKSGSKIYFWNRTASSFNLPVDIGETISQIISVNNYIYAFCNGSGNVYITNGSSISKIGKLPETIADDVVISQLSTDKGNILLALSGTDCAGVWLFDTQTNRYRLKHKFNRSTLGGVYTVSATGAISPTLCAWYNNNPLQHGVEKEETYYYSGNEAYFESELYPILVSTNKYADDENPYTFKKLEMVMLETPLGTTGFSIYWRKAIGDSWTTLVADQSSQDTFGSKNTYTLTAGSITASTIQIKVALNAPTASAVRGITLKEIILD